MVAAIVLVLLLTALGANAEDLLQSLDGGASFSVAGTIEGKLNRGDAVVVRTPASESDLAKLQALAEQDRFYAVRVGPQATASVRATCFAAPPDTIHESLTVAMANGRVVGISYVVSSPSCGVALPPGARVQLPSTTLPVHVLLPAPGPQILADLKGSQGSGPLLTNPASGGAGAAGAGRQRPGGGPASRPVGSMPTTVLPNDAPAGGQAAASEGGEAPAQPPPEQSWLQKNWLFIAGGAMVLFNVLTTATRQAGAPPGGAATGSGGGGERR